MNKVRIGVIGAGNMGCKHISALKGLQDSMELTGFFDVDGQKSVETAKAYKTTYFKDISELLNQIDAAVIAVPTPLHYNYGIMCAQRKKHILVEKPLCDSQEAADTLIKSCKHKGLILQVGHIERFNPAVAILQEIIKSMDIVSLDFKRIAPGKGRQFDTDVVHDLMIHDLDIMNMLELGKVEKIFACGNQDHGQAMVLFDRGIIASFTASRLTGERARTITVYGTDSTIMVDCQNPAVTMIDFNDKLTLHRDSKSITAESTIRKMLVNKSDALKSELASFIQSVRTGATPVVDGDTALKALQLADRINSLICSDSGIQRSE